MSSRSIFRATPFVPLIALALGCSEPPAPKAPKSEPAPSTPAAPTETVASAPSVADQLRAKLIAKLRDIPGSDVLAALEPDQRTQLEEILAGLSLQERADVARPNNPLIGVRPLLHLAAGGTSRGAYLQLAMSRAGVEELMGMQLINNDIDLSPIARVAGDLSRRATVEALHQSATPLAEGPLNLSIVDEVRELARGVDLDEIATLAVELGAVVEPGRARLMALASVRAVQKNASGARQAWDDAVKIKGVAPPDFERTVLEQVVAAETVALHQTPSNVEEAVSLARQHLLLEDLDAATATLAPYEEQAPAHLGLAVTRSRLLLKDSICPGVPGWQGNVQVCSVAWKQDPQTPVVTDLLQRAWASGTGRDAAAAEGYLGFIYVVPWMYGYIGEGATSPQGRAKMFLQRLDDFLKATQGAKQVDPMFEGVELFVTVLKEGFVAGARRRPGDRVILPKQKQDRLMKWAKELGERQEGRFPSAGVLAVSAMLAQDRDVLPVLNAVRGNLPLAQLRALAVLRVWTAAASNRVEVAVEAGKELNQLLSLTDSGSVERSELVLLMAETETALLKSEKTLRVLRHVAEPLLKADVSLALKFQAAVDVASLEARDKKLDSATRILTEVVTSFPPEQLPPEERDLWVVAKAYLLILRAQEASGADRVDYRKKLADHWESNRGGAPASVQAWISIWMEELDALSQKERCAGSKTCIDATDKRLSFRGQNLNTRVGEEAANLLRRGTLGAGTLNLSFSFAGTGQLVPVVSLEPRFLAVQFPERFLALHAK